MTFLSFKVHSGGIPLYMDGYNVKKSAQLESTWRKQPAKFECETSRRRSVRRLREGPKTMLLSVNAQLEWSNVLIAPRRTRHHRDRKEPRLAARHRERIDQSAAAVRAFCGRDQIRVSFSPVRRRRGSRRSEIEARIVKFDPEVVALFCGTSQERLSNLHRRGRRPELLFLASGRGFEVPGMPPIFSPVIFSAPGPTDSKRPVHAAFANRIAGRDRLGQIRHTGYPGRL
jgi:hypothetical protein